MFNFIETIKIATQISDFNPTSAWYMIIRGIILYFISAIITRSHKKLLGIRTPLNFILFIILGSIFAIAIIDGRHFISILIITFTLILFNDVIEGLAFRYKWIEIFIKGAPVKLIANGKINWKSMRRHSITKRDLLNELASQAHTYSIDDINTAIIESDGSINFIFKESNKQKN